MFNIGNITERFNIKVDVERVEQEFVDIILRECEKLKTDPSKVAIIIQPQLKKRKKEHSLNEGDYLVKGFVVSLADEFPIYVQPLKYFTEYDLPLVGKPISKAFLKIWIADAQLNEDQSIDGYAMTLTVGKDQDGNYKPNMPLANNDGEYGSLNINQIIGDFNGKTLDQNDINEMKKDLENDNTI